MENALYVGLSRQVVLQRQLSVIANNIANTDTPGYKAQRMQFAQHLAAAGGEGPGRGPEMSMVIDRSVLRDTRSGQTEHTGNPLDLAVLGPGYLVVETESGPLYTRTGRLAIDADGRLVDGYLVVETESGPLYTRTGRLAIDADGRLVDGNQLPVLDDGDQPIEVPNGASTLVIAPDGSISDDRGPIGRLKLVSFEQEHELKSLGGGLLASNEAPLEAVGVRVAQGKLEGSNVQPILEMTRLIEISRQYQSTQRLLQDEHNRQRDLISRLAGTSQR